MDADDVDRPIGQSNDEAHGLPTEFLDDTADTHALMYGFWRGFRCLRPNMTRAESFTKPHYFQAGYVAGFAFSLLLGVHVVRRLLR
jgi:hypothetical protein